MKRRAFIKSMGLGGAAVYIPSSLTISSLLNEAYAAGPNYDEVSVDFPATLGQFPQVINIFLYGGPSELAGNLTNMHPDNGDLDSRSQVAYTSQLNRINELQSEGNGGQITPRGFWANAGGNAMEFLVEQGYMTVYRNMYKDPGHNTQSHRQSIFMNQKGTLDIENTPGIGTRIAKVLETHAGQLPFDINSLILPFVSFEGETQLFAIDPDGPITTLAVKPTTMNSNFENPYTRGSNDNAAALDNLVSAIDTTLGSRFSKVRDSFVQRTEMENHLNGLGSSLTSPLPIMTDPVDLADDNDGTGRLVYPGGTFGNQIRAAVTLAIENSTSLFITVSNGGLGGFDDHNNGTDNYPDRMQNLFATLRAAMKHIKYSGTQTAGVASTPGGLARNTDNIIINVFGDFGRRVNLNNSMGWDHGNLQNLYTLGGQAVHATGALGKVVGTTQITGSPNTNDQYLIPTGDSFEPMAMASSVYSYFGVQNPAVLTLDPDVYTTGVNPINEAQPDVGLFTPG